MKEVIGFIGIGMMGKPMSLNLIKAGYPLMVYDINPKPLEELKGKGASIGTSCKEVASQADITITMLPKSEDVEQAILGENGVIKGIQGSSTVIDMSTIDPHYSRRIAQALSVTGAKMLDAPVSGGPMGAESGTLSSMVGGEKEVYEICLNIFNAMGKKIY